MRLIDDSEKMCGVQMAVSWERLARIMTHPLGLRDVERITGFRVDNRGLTISIETKGN